MDATKHQIRPPKPWVQSICRVDWTCIFFSVVLGIATVAVGKAQVVQRPVFVRDATIAFSHGPNTIEHWVAVTVPILVLAFSAAVLEFAVFKSQGKRRSSIMLFNVILAMFAALTVTAFHTELFKRLCGRLRPDFLARCKPSTPPAGLDSTAYGTFPAVTCTNSDHKAITDGHLSFPSGHSSGSMAVGLFGALYVLWAVHGRPGGDLLGAAAAYTDSELSLVKWVKVELLRLAVMLLVLFQLVWPWGVAVSRFRDNRHNVSDIIGGMLLGACFAPIFLARLVVHFNGWSALDQQAESAVSSLPLQTISVGTAPKPPATPGPGRV